jgi:hypothetical protein
MARSRIRKAKPQPTTAQDPIATLARDIIMYGSVPRRPNFWDQCAEQLLLELLPLGIPTTLERLEAMQAAEHDKVQSSIVAEAYGAVCAHVHSLENLVPKGVIFELYRRRRDLYPECYS